MLELILDLIRDGSVTDEKVGRALDAALIRYSEDRPRAVVADVVLAARQVLPALTGWENAWSMVRWVEVPVGEIPPCLLDVEGYFVRSTPTGDQICLLDARTIGETLRIGYTVRHSADTVPVVDHEAVACWAAALLADQIAAQFSTAAQPTIQADSTDVALPSREWAARARAWRGRYAALIGVQGVTGSGNDKPVTKPAGTVVDFDLDDITRRPTLYWRGQR